MIKRNRNFYLTLIISSAAAIIGFIALFFINKLSAVIFLIVTLFILSLFLALTYKRMEEIRELSSYLECINSGRFELALSDNEEGELSILKNNIYKVVVKLRSQSELLNKDKSYLADSLADISHQLKTPITSIMMMTDLLKHEKDNAKRQEFTDIIDGQLDRINWLIVTLLKLSRIDSGAIEFNNKSTEMKSVIEQSVRQFLIGAEIKNISVIQKCADDIYADIDENWCVEAISNIIKNCIEHTDNGGEIFVSAEDGPIYTKLIIKDNGCGIDKEDLPHIFERFYQGKNHSATSIGIGLALSKSIFNRMGATIEVKSELNIGTEFEIKIYKVVV